MMKHRSQHCYHYQCFVVVAVVLCESSLKVSLCLFLLSCLFSSYCCPLCACMYARAHVFACTCE